MAEVDRRIVVAEGIGANLRRLRTKAELSRDQLAERADIGHGHLSKIENGGLLCRIDTLVKLAAALGATADDLLLSIGWQRQGDHGGRFKKARGGHGDAG
jgi:transcriptional regulator with XRE-family HTH domain